MLKYETQELCQVANSLHTEATSAIHKPITE